MYNITISEGNKFLLYQHAVLTISHDRDQDNKLKQLENFKSDLTGYLWSDIQHN